MKTKKSIEEHPCVKGKNVPELLEKGFSEIGFTLKSVKEIIRDLELLKSKGVSYFRKVSKGMEMGYQAKVNDFMIVAWTSYIFSQGIFRPDDQMWVLIIDLRTDDPFFSFPMNRIGDFLSRLFNTARVYRSVAEHWPHCSQCKSRLFWSKIQSNNFEVIDEEFHNRSLVCGNKDCSEYRIDTKLYVTDIQLPNAADQKFFVGPFKRSQKTRHRNRIKRKGTIPRRLIRYWTKLGIKLETKNAVYHDLDWEKKQKGKVHLYNEEAIEDLLYYDERENQTYAD